MDRDNMRPLKKRRAEKEIMTNCEHKNKEIRKKLGDGKIKWLFFEQCLDCGYHRRVKALENRQVPRFDDELYRQWQTEKQLKCQQASMEWWRRYEEYRKSPEWHAKRQDVLKRCRNVCERCGQDEAVHIHHLSYKHFGNEPLEDLLGVCVECHGALHYGRQLITLYFDGAQITDAVLGCLERVRALEGLNLHETNGTDDGLAHLKGMNQLKFLRLNGCQRVTDAGVESLQRALPRCQILMKRPS